MVGRRLAALLVNHPHFELKMLVGSDARSRDSYRAVWEAKERALQSHYGTFWKQYPFPAELEGMRVSSFEDLLHSPCSIVFSSIPERAGELEEELLASGKLVFSNSPHRRFDGRVALVVPEVNGLAIRDSRLIKNPNCVTSGLVLVLAPLAAAFGMREVVVTTYQSLSGRGDAKYATELVLSNVYPLHASSERTEEYILREVKKIMGISCPVSVTCNRICVQEGHLVEVRVKTNKPIKSAQEVSSIFSTFNPLGTQGLYSSPKKPILVLSETGRPMPVQDAHYDGGMAIAVGNISVEDEIFDLRLTYVVNNLVRGAAGGALLNAELWRAMNRLEPLSQEPVGSYGAS